MSIVEVFLIGIALSMDAFAVSITNGMIIKQVTLRKALAIALTFGAYQCAMPIIGYLGASLFYHFISAIDHWIAFILLSGMGGKMIAETLRELKSAEKAALAKSADTIASLPFKELMVQGVATSIDALAVGISFAAMPTLHESYATTLLFSAIYPSLLIGATTTALCLPAVFIGKKTGGLLHNKAQLVGGAILVGIGIKILLEHLVGTS